MHVRIKYAFESKKPRLALCIRLRRLGHKPIGSLEPSHSFRACRRILHIPFGSLQNHSILWRFSSHSKFVAYFQAAFDCLLSHYLSIYSPLYPFCETFACYAVQLKVIHTRVQVLRLIVMRFLYISIARSQLLIGNGIFIILFIIIERK